MRKAPTSSGPSAWIRVQTPGKGKEGEAGTCSGLSVYGSRLSDCSSSFTSVMPYASRQAAVGQPSFSSQPNLPYTMPSAVWKSSRSILSVPSVNGFLPRR